jgi:hypothetical protein
MRSRDDDGDARVGDRVLDDPDACGDARGPATCALRTLLWDNRRGGLGQWRAWGGTGARTTHAQARHPSCNEALVTARDRAVEEVCS